MGPSMHLIYNLDLQSSLVYYVKYYGLWKKGGMKRIDDL